jgi:TetR/AcrR family transcriptional repressor of lmrAB and yxaGH operons
MPGGETTTKAKMILATLDLLKGSGLSGAGINNIVATSGAPKGSVYHFFPAGKHGVVAAALREAERSVGEGLRSIFSQPTTMPQKVRHLFDATAARLEASAFMKGCPVAAVTLDIDADSRDLRTRCEAVFDTWRDIIASGLHDVPASDRRDVAQLILAVLEGALILSRAKAAPEPLNETGALLATTLARAFQRPPAKHRSETRESAPRPRRSS